MKYRVKDPKKRELVKELFDVEIFYSNLADTELRVDLSFAGSNFASNHLPVEPAQELADGWHPYPNEKPQKDGKYLCVWKCQDGSIVPTVTTFQFKKFVDWNSSIFGWRELPKVWKGD